MLLNRNVLLKKYINLFSFYTALLDKVWKCSWKQCLCKGGFIVLEQEMCFSCRVLTQLLEFHFAG